MRRFWIGVAAVLALSLSVAGRVAVIALDEPSAERAFDLIVLVTAIVTLTCLVVLVWISYLRREVARAERHTVIAFVAQAAFDPPSLFPDRPRGPTYLTVAADESGLRALLGQEVAVQVEWALVREVVLGTTITTRPLPAIVVKLRDERTITFAPGRTAAPILPETKSAPVAELVRRLDDLRLGRR